MVTTETDDRPVTRPPVPVEADVSSVARCSTCLTLRRSRRVSSTSPTPSCSDNDSEGGSDDDGDSGEVFDFCILYVRMTQSRDKDDDYRINREKTPPVGRVSNVHSFCPLHV